MRDLVERFGFGAECDLYSDIAFVDGDPPPKLRNTEAKTTFDLLWFYSNL